MTNLLEKKTFTLGVMAAEYTAVIIIFTLVGPSLAAPAGFVYLFLGLWAATLLVRLANYKFVSGRVAGTFMEPWWSFLLTSAAIAIILFMITALAIVISELN